MEPPVNNNLKILVKYRDGLKTHTAETLNNKYISGPVTEEFNNYKNNLVNNQIQYINKLIDSKYNQIKNSNPVITNTLVYNFFMNIILEINKSINNLDFRIMLKLYSENLKKFVNFMLDNNLIKNPIYKPDLDNNQTINNLKLELKNHIDTKFKKIDQNQNITYKDINQFYSDTLFEIIGILDNLKNKIFYPQIKSHVLGCLDCNARSNIKTCCEQKESTCLFRKKGSIFEQDRCRPI